jgi:hypothetical protein
VSRRLVLALAFIAYAAPASAQTIEFLSRYAFYVSFEHLSSDERRFEWSGNWGGDLDIVDYGFGRFNFAANYEAVLGDEFREFDPNQGNYVLEGSLSVRPPRAEVSGVFHHVSRHLSDRPKRGAVDWNMMGARIAARTTRGRLELRNRADVRGVIQKTFVDYTWELETDSRARIGLSPRTALVASGGLRVLGVDGTRDRGTQVGFRGEGAWQLVGRGAALDLFAAVERRIDPYQLEFSTATWLTAGFRLSSR